MVKFAGGRIYEKLKPLFVGLITAELIAGLVTVVVGLLYWLQTGSQPPVEIMILVI